MRNQLKTRTKFVYSVSVWSQAAAKKPKTKKMANNNKRLRSEELNQLDDSMQSLVSEFKIKEKRNVEDVCQFMASYIEKS